MSEQVKECMDLEHCLHWLHLEPTHRIFDVVWRRANLCMQLVGPPPGLGCHIPDGICIGPACAQSAKAAK
jgi:hypothetical protein